MGTGTVKGFWQHTNGDVYAVESTPFGEIIGAAGPIEVEQLGKPEDYEYKIRIVDWVERALSEGTLHSFPPEVKKQQQIKKTFLEKCLDRILSRISYFVSRISSLVTRDDGVDKNEAID